MERDRGTNRHKWRETETDSQREKRRIITEPSQKLGGRVGAKPFFGGRVASNKRGGVVTLRTSQIITKSYDSEISFTGKLNIYL
jgi:hypothetical protein